MCLVAVLLISVDPAEASGNTAEIENNVLVLTLSDSTPTLAFNSSGVSVITDSGYASLPPGVSGLPDLTGYSVTIPNSIYQSIQVVLPVSTPLQILFPSYLTLSAWPSGGISTTTTNVSWSATNSDIQELIDMSYTADGITYFGLDEPQPTSVSGLITDRIIVSQAGNSLINGIFGGFNILMTYGGFVLLLTLPYGMRWAIKLIRNLGGIWRNV